jgi:tetratricopeptide (TPR) repeat protein
MADKIFINYRRDDSIGMAGRLHDRLAQTFGRDRLFMDVDHIPVGADFVAHLNSQVAACEVVLVVIGRNWLRAKDKAGQRRLHQPDDFVAIEIAAALARDIRVIPVLVDGARMPKESELPDSLKPLARRQAVDVRHSHFGHDAEALVKRMREALGEEVPVAREREALGDEKAGPGRWRVRAAIGAAAVAVLLLIGWGGYAFVQRTYTTIEKTVQQREAVKAEQERQARAAAEAEDKRKAEETERQRLAKVEQERQARAAAEAEEKRRAEEAERQRLAKVEQERQARAAEAEAKRRAEQAEQQRLAKAEERQRLVAEAEEKRRAEETERQRLAAVRAEEDRRAKAAAEAEANRKTEAERQRNEGVAAGRAGDYDRAIANFNEAIRLNQNDAGAYYGRGFAYSNKGDDDRAIADYNETIRLNPRPVAFYSRGFSYARKGDNDRAIADYNEVIRLDPKNAGAFCNRGISKREIYDASSNADIAKARELDASVCR